MNLSYYLLLPRLTIKKSENNLVVNLRRLNEKTQELFSAWVLNNDGGERGSRTLDTLRYTHFPGVLLRPLGHLTNFLQLLKAQY